MMTKVAARTLLFTVIGLFLSLTLQAQTPAFTYQGRLTDGALAASGIYDMQFKLFDGVGTQIGSTVTHPTVQVTNGVFTVQLNAGSEFGVAAFNGANRFLEVSVRKPGDPDYTPLSPRQQITSVPYALRSNDAATAANFTGSMTGDVTGTQASTTVARINGSPLGSTIGAGNGQVLAWDGAAWSKSGNFTTGDGTPNLIPKFTGSRSFGNSSITDDATTVTTSGQLDVTGGTGTVYTTAPIEIRTVNTPRIAFHWPGVFAAQLGIDGTGVIRTYNNPGSGYEQFAASNVYSNGFVSINSGQDLGGNIRFAAANPYIVASSYFVAPGGAFFSSGTVFVEADMKLRGGVSNDAGNFGGDVQVNDGLRVAGKLDVTGGSVYIANPSSLIITSPNGTCWFITVSNAGALSTFSVTCP